MKSNKGITLIELLVVIVIVGILAAIAIPVYTNYMQRARRADAKTALEHLRAAQEMFRAENGLYAFTGAVVNGVAILDAMATLQTTWGVPATPGDYGLIFIVQNASSFTVEAQPITARQTPDGSLFIRQDGRKWDSDGSVWPQGKWAK
jgi:type IV pilus assembly protein PilE